MDLDLILNQIKDMVKDFSGKEVVNSFVETPKNDFELKKPEKMEKQDLSDLSDEEIIEMLPRLIDHTILKADATEKEVEKIVEEAIQYNFYSVCVNSSMTSYIAKKLEGTNVKVCSVVGFPLGAMSTKAKAYEAKIAVEDGADEIDMVLNVGALKDQDFHTVLSDISAVVNSSYPAKVKVILETALLTDQEKIVGCTLSKTAGAHFVKTSTGFSTSGATVEDIALMRKMVGPNMGVKASGGVRDQATALAMVKAGANRVGASASIKIVEG